MILRTAGHPHLTYCTNIHPGESWSEVKNNLERFLLPVKTLVCPTHQFGVGLRLSAHAARELSRGDELEAFREFLGVHNLYIFTINGFPYGTFHRTRIKEAVYRPDWTEEKRLTYSDMLATILAKLLPHNHEAGGSVSTIPGGFKPVIQSWEDTQCMVDRLVRHAVTLHNLHESTGQLITLALEPEPHCFLETIDETTAFFQEHLFGSTAINQFSQLSGLDRSRIEETLRRHLGVCLDTCHAAVEFEDPVQAVHKLQHAGIKIAKVQLSTGIRIPTVGIKELESLTAFVDEVYLHQVVERRDDFKVRYLDLPGALTSAQNKPEMNGEWRIHFHIPIFLKHVGLFENTQDFLECILSLQRDAPFTHHLEVETYTWDVLPEKYRVTDLVNAIARELNWVIERMTP